jgi:acetyltransferase-like isoleucine patch superfamily enzyme/dTDP-4-dehydrorhamnose 3,5-epimerase-like enzyme
VSIHPDAFIHPQAIVEDGATIGARTRVWAFVHILGGAVIGEDCNICDHVFIENDVRIGDRVTVKSGVQLWDAVRLEDDVFVGPNATFTNDRFPRSKAYPEEYPQMVVHKDSSIGANACLLPGVTIGAGAMVGAASVVTRDVPAHAVVLGNPASITGYVDARRVEGTSEEQPPEHSTEVNVRGVRLIEMPEVVDIRGRLSFAEIGNGLPFEPQRYFLIYGVPNREVRGEHAHRELQELLVCVAGEVRMIVDDGTVREEIHLDRPNLGLYVPPMVWRTQYQFSPDAVLLALASSRYDPEDYIRDYDQFLSEL